MSENIFKGYSPRLSSSTYQEISQWEKQRIERGLIYKNSKDDNIQVDAFLVYRCLREMLAYESGVEKRRTLFLMGELLEGVEGKLARLMDEMDRLMVGEDD